jgi:hypothetical protein
MRFSFNCFFGVLIFTGLACSPALPQTSLSGNLGLTLSKSIVGVSYTNGKNEWNFGLKDSPILFGSRVMNDNGEFQPGLTYNRRLTANGLYASATYAPVYNRPGNYACNPGRFPLYGDRQCWDEGWNAGEVFLGAGKDFQWESWGITLDANLITPANRNFGTSLSFGLGAGMSYRFKLD